MNELKKDFDIIKNHLLNNFNDYDIASNHLNDTLYSLRRSGKIGAEAFGFATVSQFYDCTDKTNITLLDNPLIPLSHNEKMASIFEQLSNEDKAKKDLFINNLKSGKTADIELSNNSTLLQEIFNEYNIKIHARTKGQLNRADKLTCRYNGIQGTISLSWKYMKDLKSKPANGIQSAIIELYNKLV